MNFYMYLKLFSIGLNSIFIIVGLIYYPQIESTLFFKAFGGPIFILALEVGLCFLVMKYRKQLEDDRISLISIKIVKKSFFVLGCCGLIARPFGSRD